MKPIDKRVFIQHSFCFCTEGNTSIKSLSEKEIKHRIDRTSNPKQRALESLINVPEHIFTQVHEGLKSEMKRRYR